MNKGDLKKLTQQIMLEEKLENNNQNQSQIIVQDVSKGSDSDGENSESTNLMQNMRDKSEDKLETESEAASVQKVTSNPQGPASTEPYAKMPLTPRKALEMYSDVLTDYEQSEIL